MFTTHLNCHHHYHHHLQVNLTNMRMLRLISLTETLIIVDITKTESNNCIFIH